MARPGYEADRQVLMLRNLESGETKKLTDAWGPLGRPRSRGRQTASRCTSRRRTRSKIRCSALDAAGGKVERLKATTEAFRRQYRRRRAASRWRPALFAQHRARPTDLYVRDAKGKVGQITAVNAATLAQFDQVEMDRVQFAGANGDKVWGIILKPVSPVQKLPVAFIVHGGPQGSFGNSWSTRWNPRLFAQQGYGVVSIDFHGSTGYGRAFTDSINKDWGGKPLEDLEARPRCGGQAGSAARPR